MNDPDPRNRPRIDTGLRRVEGPRETPGWVPGAFAAGALILVAGMAWFVFGGFSEKPKGRGRDRVEPIPVPRPAHGTLSVLNGRAADATLELLTSGDGAYFLKFRETETRRVVFTLYAEAGRPLVAKVPSGTYELIYARGANWEGERTHFGPRALVMRASQSITLVPDDPSTPSHLQLSLDEVRGGNLPVRLSSGDEF